MHHTLKFIAAIAACADLGFMFQLPTPAPEPQPEPPTPGRQRLTCEHCECQLTPTGDVLRMSDTARAHLKANETIAKLRADLQEARDAATKAAADLDAANAEIRRLSTPEEKPGFFRKVVQE